MENKDHKVCWIWLGDYKEYLGLRLIVSLCMIRVGRLW
jgi:hypothetical protein